MNSTAVNDRNRDYKEHTTTQRLSLSPRGTPREFPHVHELKELFEEKAVKEQQEAERSKSPPKTRNIIAETKKNGENRAELLPSPKKITDAPSAKIPSATPPAVGLSASVDKLMPPKLNTVHNFSLPSIPPISIPSILVEYQPSPREIFLSDFYHALHQTVNIVSKRTGEFKEKALCRNVKNFTLALSEKKSFMWVEDHEPKNRSTHFKNILDELISIYNAGCRQFRLQEKPSSYTEAIFTKKNQERRYATIKGILSPKSSKKSASQNQQRKGSLVSSTSVNISLSYSPNDTEEIFSSSSSVSPKSISPASSSSSYSPNTDSPPSPSSLGDVLTPPISRKLSSAQKIPFDFSTFVLIKLMPLTYVKTILQSDAELKKTWTRFIAKVICQDPFELVDKLLPILKGKSILVESQPLSTSRRSLSIRKVEVLKPPLLEDSPKDLPISLDELAPPSPLHKSALFMINLLSYFQQKKCGIPQKRRAVRKRPISWNSKAIILPTTNYDPVKTMRQNRRLSLIVKEEGPLEKNSILGGNPALFIDAKPQNSSTMILTSSSADANLNYCSIEKKRRTEEEIDTFVKEFWFTNTVNALSFQDKIELKSDLEKEPGKVFVYNDKKIVEAKSYLETVIENFKLFHKAYNAFFSSLNNNPESVKLNPAKLDETIPDIIFVKNSKEAPFLMHMLANLFRRTLNATLQNQFIKKKTYDTCISNLKKISLNSGQIKDWELLQLQMSHVYLKLRSKFQKIKLSH
jgi:hypothetical protein